MPTTIWPLEFEDILRKYLPLLPADRSITPELDLGECGLDSLGTVGLLLELEGGFNIMIPDEMLTTTMFRTAGSLWQVVAESGAR